MHMILQVWTNPLQPQMEKHKQQLKKIALQPRTESVFIIQQNSQSTRKSFAIQSMVGSIQNLNTKNSKNIDTLDFDITDLNKIFGHEFCFNKKVFKYEKQFQQKYQYISNDCQILITQIQVKILKVLHISKNLGKNVDQLCFSGNGQQNIQEAEFQSVFDLQRQDIQYNNQTYKFSQFNLDSIVFTHENEKLVITTENVMFGIIFKQKVGLRDCLLLFDNAFANSDTNINTKQITIQNKTVQKNKNQYIEEITKYDFSKQKYIIYNGKKCTYINKVQEKAVKQQVCMILVNSNSIYFEYMQQLIYQLSTVYDQYYFITLLSSSSQQKGYFNQKLNICVENQSNLCMSILTDTSQLLNCQTEIIPPITKSNNNEIESPQIYTNTQIRDDINIDLSQSLQQQHQTSDDSKINTRQNVFAKREVVSSLVQTQFGEQSCSPLYIQIFSGLNKLVFESGHLNQLQKFLNEQQKIVNKNNLDSIYTYQSNDKFTLYGVKTHLISKGSYIIKNIPHLVVLLNQKSKMVEQLLCQLQQIQKQFQEQIQIVIIIGNVMQLTLQQQLQETPILQEFLVAEDQQLFYKSVLINKQNSSIFYYLFNSYDQLHFQSNHQIDELSNTVNILLKQEIEQKKLFQNPVATYKQIAKQDSLNYYGTDLPFIINKSQNQQFNHTFIAFLSLKVDQFSTEFLKLVRIALKYKMVRVVFAVLELDAKNIQQFTDTYNYAQFFGFVQIEQQFYNFVKESASLFDNQLSPENEEQNNIIDSQKSFYSVFDDKQQITMQGFECVNGLNLLLQNSQQFNPYDTVKVIPEDADADCRSLDQIIFMGKTYKYINNPINMHQQNDMILIVKLNSQQGGFNLSTNQVIQQLLKFQQQYKQLFIVVSLTDITTKQLFQKIAGTNKQLQKITCCTNINDDLKNGVFYQNSLSIQQQFDQFYDLEEILTIGGHLQLVQKEESQNELVADQICLQDLQTEENGLNSQLVFRGTSLSYCTKPQPFKQWFSLVYIDGRSEKFEENVFNVYQYMESFLNIHFAICVYKQQNKIFQSKMQRQFNFGQKLNLVNYKQGLNKRLHKLFDFDQILVTLFSDQGDEALVGSNLQAIQDYFSINQSQIQLKSIPSVQIINNNLILKGEILRNYNLKYSLNTKNFVLITIKFDLNNIKRFQYQLRLIYNIQVKLINNKSLCKLLICIPGWKSTDFSSKNIKNSLDLQLLNLYEDRDHICQRFLNKNGGDIIENCCVVFKNGQIFRTCDIKNLELTIQVSETETQQQQETKSQNDEFDVQSE